MINQAKDNPLRRRRLVRGFAATATALVAWMAPPVQSASAVGGAGTVAHHGAAVEAPWVEGKSDQDTIESCTTGTAVTGVMASVAWQPLSDQVPRVGERFNIRATAALVGQPCSGGVTMFPELMAPTGLTYGDDANHPVLWGVRNIDDPVALSSGGLVYKPGSNGGVVLLRDQEKSFILGRGQVLEVQIPVIATKEMKGIATLQPECLDRRNGVRPCPPEQSGDHFQVAFRVGGHGGNKTYVTPYVGLFAQPALQTPAVPNPPATHPSQPGAQPVASRVMASYKVSSRKSGKARVTAQAGSAIPTGSITVFDGRNRIGRAVLATSDKGKTSLKLPRLRKGAHRLSVRYGGSPTVAPSRTKIRKVTVR